MRYFSVKRIKEKEKNFGQSLIKFDEFLGFLPHSLNTGGAIGCGKHSKRGRTLDKSDTCSLFSDRQIQNDEAMGRHSFRICCNLMDIVRGSGFCDSSNRWISFIIKSPVSWNFSPRFFFFPYLLQSCQIFNSSFVYL